MKESDLKHIVNQSPDMICTIDGEGRFLWVNRASESLLGYTPGEMKGRSYLEMVCEEDLPDTDQISRKIMDGYVVTQFENRYIRKDRTLMPLIWSARWNPEEEKMYAIARDGREKRVLVQLAQRAGEMARIGHWELDLLQADGGDRMYWSRMTKEILEVDNDYNPSLSGGFEFCEEESRDRIQEAVETLISEGRSFDETLLIHTQRGNSRWVRCIGQGEYAGEECVKIFGSFQDIHDLKEAQEELELAYEDRTRILESIGDAFFTVNPDWVVTYWNGEAERLLQRPREEILGKNIWEVYPDAVELDFYTQYHWAMRTGEIARFEEFYPTAGFWLEVTAYPSDDGLSIYFRDVTERKEAEQEMRDLNRQLQDHSEKLELINKELEQFAYVASHDLQEPLRMVTNFLSKLEKHLGENLDDSSRLYMHFAVDGATRMRQVILDLLDYSRAGESTDPDREVDLESVTRRAWQALQSRVDATNGMLKTDFRTGRTVQSDPVLLKQILQNLLSNSLKYHRDGVPPEVTISTRILDDGWELEVTDNGLGMEEEYLDKIFVIFQRLHRADEYEGTGIGLAIVQKMVRQLKGQITVTSIPGEGSSFRIQFPAQSDNQPDIQ
ncbi:MAG: PAS domain S-box protein [Balneolaceae bacterium]